MAEKKKHTGRNVTIGAAALALLLLGGHFGLNGGFGPGGPQALPGSQTTPGSQPTQAAQTKAPGKEDVLAIRVHEDQITLNDQTMDMAQLEKTLLERAGDGIAVELVDDQAIKAAYDEVTALLDRLDIPYQAQKES